MWESQVKERVFNLFVFIEDDIIRRIGAVMHEMDGSDEDKLAFLQFQFATDLPEAKRYPVPSRYILINDGERYPGAISYDGFMELASIGRQTEFFEEVFKELKAPPRPLMCVTPVVDGKPKIDLVSSL